MGWREKARRAKRLHRPSLKNWECDGLHATFPAFARSILQSDLYQSFAPFGGAGGEDGKGTSSNRPSGSSVENRNTGDVRDVGGERGDGDHGVHRMIPAVVDARQVSAAEFIDRYESKSTPAVISGIPGGWDDGDDDDRTSTAAEEAAGSGSPRRAWPAVRRWDLDRLESDPDLRDRYFKVGEDDDGKSVRMKLKHFIRYLRSTRDDSPLYIFDSSFDEDRKAKQLLDDYQVPTYFNEDLFHLVGEKRRPPYRWFLVGPERSGTCVHIDPLGTSAWNTLINGTKRWVLFPPHVPKSVVKGRGLILPDEDDEAIHYFMTILPRIKRRAASSDGTGDYENFACYEFTQNAGETVFIPNGWWHAVLNLTDTVGVTQNFSSQRNFDEVWVKTRSGRKKMAYKWLCQLDTHYPHLAERARDMNKRDRFVMRYDPVEVGRREKEEERRRRAKREAREKSRKDKWGKHRSKRDKHHISERNECNNPIPTSHQHPKENISDRDSKRRCVSPP